MTSAPAAGCRTHPARAPIATIGALAAGAAVVWARDPSVPGRYPSCPFKALTGWDCIGCGSLRGTHALLHGDLAGAIDHNLLLLPGLALVAWLLVAWLAHAVGRPIPTLRATPTVTAVVLTVGLGFWVARNLPWFPQLAA